jgi:hypothetical protein
MWATFGSQAGQQGRLAGPGRAGDEHRESRPHAGPEEGRHRRLQHPQADELVELADLDAGELPDVDKDVPVASDVPVDDVQPGPGVELGVLEALRRVELAVRTAGVVEDLGQDPPDMVVVVEDLVVVAAHTLVAPDEDQVRAVDHDLPDVRVVEEGLQRAVTGQIAEGPLGRHRRLGHVAVAPAALVLVAPRRDLLVDQARQRGRGVVGGHVDRHLLGPILDRPLDLHEGRSPPARHNGHRQPPPA